ncbi:hypothetical protein PsorP6_005397 [Peronosclerospora sorghi]|uniref:Uncharacterized protein n=1 Tax=Peronosclerospora sorghi TaxID=230839 RepID=A0ACC0W1H8_9STRA|nr:hypothetical protein PsorP6_005397 [Peronosclerospora sorghi]
MHETSRSPPSITPSYSSIEIPSILLEKLQDNRATNGVPSLPSLSRFLQCVERRSRAVVPADSAQFASNDQTKKRCGTSSSEPSMHRLSGSVLLRRIQRIRLAVGDFMRQLSVELFFVMIVLVYGVFVTVQLTMANETLLLYKLAIDVTDITVGSLLLLEIILKVFAYGAHYLKNGWALFDAVVIIVSFALGIVAAIGATSSILVKILRLRVILRVFRILVVFERVKQRSKSMNLMHLNRGDIATPVEHVLRILNELRSHPTIASSLRDGLEFVIDTIKNNKLYDANEELLAVEGVDDDTQNWLRGEILKENDMDKVLPDAKEMNDLDGSSISSIDLEDTAEVGSIVPNMKLRSSHRRHINHRHLCANRTDTMRDLLPMMDSATDVELQNLLQSTSLWHFDVFRVDFVSGGNALCYLGHYLLRGSLCQALNIESKLLVTFFMEIQRGYVATNPYHNAIHAADVMQTVYYFLIQPELTPFLRPLDRALSLLAAAVHDFMHDGFNNGFHISTSSDIALRYNDHAVLENYHVAQSFLVMKNADRNILGQLAPEDFKYARDMIIQMVLATDMAKHFEDVALFKTTILSAALEESAVLVKNVGDKKLLLKMILHTCDVSNPAKERETMLRWTDRVVEEFFIQGDMEKQLGLPVSPFMDRDTIVLKKMQVGFADFIVSPLFSIWAQILSNVNVGPHCILRSNREFWASLPEDFKPHMIKDVLYDLSAQRQRDSLTQNTIPEEIVSPRSRHNITSMLLETDDG